MSLTQSEKEVLISEIGSQVAKKAQETLENNNKETQELIKTFESTKYLKEEDKKALETKLEENIERLEKTLKDQGVSLAEVNQALTKVNDDGVSIESKLHEDKEKIDKVKSQGVGAVKYMLTKNSKGQPVLKNLEDVTRKAAAVHGTIPDIEVGSLASIAQNFDASTILRLGANAQMFDEYRNNQFIFDLCNTVTTSPDQKFAIWMDEQPRDGASAEVPEGGTKPKVQYLYDLQSEAYKKEAHLLSFTDEFDMDFGELQQRILVNGRTDLVNRINSAILPRMQAAATQWVAAVDGPAFTGGEIVPNVNNYDAIVAMAAKADSATFGSAMTNAALMNTNRKYRTGITKDVDGNYLNTPGIIDNIAMVGNPEVGVDQITVGDFMQYNILLRGGMIVKVGYNGTDFAENKFSVVMEQFYYDYISTIRAQALVNGTFTDVRTSISA